MTESSVMIRDSSTLPPFLIEPYFDRRVWGFRDLRPWYDRTVASGEEPIGEVWLTGDECRAASGPVAGKSLAEVFAESSGALLGANSPVAQSPLLVKVIFAREKLSVQVHPDDRLAQKYGQPRGKTECWYALAAEPGALVAAGLKPGVTMDQVRAGIHDGTLEQSLNMLPVSPGDMIFMDAGTVHSIWPGSILLETQQNCDITYRMYDYGRPRELHIEKSLEATRLVTRAGKIPPRPLADRTISHRCGVFPRGADSGCGHPRQRDPGWPRMSRLRGWPIFSLRTAARASQVQSLRPSICRRAVSPASRRLLLHSPLRIAAVST